MILFKKRKFMLKIYIKIALRNLQNRLTFSLINITGLAIGMARGQYSFLHGHKMSTAMIIFTPIKTRFIRCGTAL